MWLLTKSLKETNVNEHEGDTIPFVSFDTGEQFGLYFKNTGSLPTMRIAISARILHVGLLCHTSQVVHEGRGLSFPFYSWLLFSGQNRNHLCSASHFLRPETIPHLTWRSEHATLWSPRLCLCHTTNSGTSSLVRSREKYLLVLLMGKGCCSVSMPAR